MFWVILKYNFLVLFKIKNHKNELKIEKFLKIIKLYDQNEMAFKNKKI